MKIESLIFSQKYERKRTDFGTYFIQKSIVEMEDSLLREAAQLAAELGLRGADSTYVAVAARLDLPLITLDIDQRERAKKRVTVLEV